LIKFTILVKFQENILSYVYPISILMYQSYSNAVLEVNISGLKLLSAVLGDS
jgi:hypothetical protein